MNPILNNLPAVPPVAGSAEAGNGVGRFDDTAPRPSAGRATVPAGRRRSQAEGLDTIVQSHDVMGLKRMVADANQPIALRNAAERRLRKLVRKPRL